MKTVFMISLLIASAGGTGVAQQSRAAENVTLRGCLIATSDGYELATEGEHLYKLTRSTAALANAAGKEVSLRGEVSRSNANHPSFAVAELQEIFTRPYPSLSSTFSSSSTWHAKTNRIYGIKVSHPTGMADVAASGQNRHQLNFATAADISVTIGAFRIPRSFFANTNFVGGSFSVFVNPQIKSAEACSSFKYPSKTAPSLHRYNGVQYVVQKSLGVGLGTAYISESYHTFRNGFCYEADFEIGEYDTSNEDLGCKVPRMRASDETKLIEPLVVGISFFPPSVAKASADGRPVPARMTELKPSSRVADSALNYGRIQIAWSSEGADYIQLSYKCYPPPEKPGVMINDDSSRDCQNSKAHIEYSPPAKLPPSGVREISIRSYKRDTPIDVIVTATPFLGGVAYPIASKTTTIKVNPTNLLQRK